MTSCVVMAASLEVVPHARIEVRFRHEKHDWLRMRVRARAERPVFVRREGATASRHPARQTLSMRVSSGYCPFPGLIAWLEAIASGVQECAFEWEAEGPDGRLEWDRPFLAVRWRQHGETRVLEVRSEAPQLVAAFYAAFRGFVESEAYQPLRYEELRNGEQLALMIGNRFSEAELIGQLLEEDREAAEARLDAIWPVGPSELNPGALPWIDAGWRVRDTSRRRKYLQEVFDLRGGGRYGTNLRTLRSAKIEQWLEREIGRADRP